MKERNLTDFFQDGEVSVLGSLEVWRPRKK